jgi:hypothetical protein
LELIMSHGAKAADATKAAVTDTTLPSAGPKPAKAAARMLPPGEHERWSRFVAASSMGAVYYTADYLEALCAATGGSFQILAVEKGTEILGGVALYVERTRFGASVSDRRMLYYNGLVLRDYDTKYPSVRTSKHLDTMSILEEALRKLGYANLRLKSRAPFADPRLFVERGWRAIPAFSYVVPVADPKQQWERVEQNLRRLVDRCEKEGVQFSDEGGFARFFEMHAATSDRKGAPLYLPRARFERYFEALKAKNLARLYEARLPRGQAVASQLVLLGSHPVCHTVSAAADPAHHKLGANAFLRWKTFEALAALGYKANDLTDASLNPVTHFKSQLGGELELAWVLQAPQSAMFRLGDSLHRMRRRLR